jgi:hypothetical protein
MDGKMIENWNSKVVPCGACDGWKKLFPTKGGNRPKEFFTKLGILRRGWALNAVNVPPSKCSAEVFDYADTKQMAMK